MASGEDAQIFKLDQVCCAAALRRTFTLERRAGADDSEKIFVVGRLADCDFCLDSPDLPCFISRQHARITVRKFQVYVTDLKSVNGTFINDVMLEPFAKTPLLVGDTVMFGCVSLEAAIEPGSAVQQDNPLFKFELKNEEGPQDDRLRQRNKSTDFEYMTICQPDRELESKNATAKSDTADEILPLTVKNLVAFAGCNFAHILSDEKENLNTGKTGGSSEKTTKRSGGKKRRRTTVYARKKNLKKDSEACAFFDCKVSRLSDSVVSWVQCDYCNGWFHTDCIGCDYDTVKLAQNKFACGQC